MKKEYEAIVVGGGMAGLTSAAYLCRYGIRTLLVEKEEKTGGLVNTFWHQGFAFDGGIRAFENSGILLPMLKSLGIDIEFSRSPVSIGIENQWVDLASRDSLQNYTSMLKQFFPDNCEDIDRIADEIKRVIKYMDVLYGIDNPLFLENIFDREYLTKTLLPWFIKYQINIRKASRLNEPIYAYLKRFTKNDSLIDIIAQHFFKNTPSFFALSYFGLYLDYCYPLAGTGVLPQKMTDYICRMGGEVLTGISAKRVDVHNHEIELSSGEAMQYKNLIWAADQKTLYEITKGVSTSDIAKQRLLTEKGTGGDSVLTVFMGVSLDKDYFINRCGNHAFYTPNTIGLSSLNDWRFSANQGYGELLNWVGSFLERTTYEISCPVLHDASLAPDGSTGIILSTLIDYELVKFISDLGKYELFKHFCTSKIIDLFESTRFAGIRENILFTLCATPLTIERVTGNAHGAITGWAFTNSTPPAENRFRKIAKSVRTPLDDIVQCGQWVFSPSGLPVSILTGKLAADSVRKTLREKRHGTYNS